MGEGALLFDIDGVLVDVTRSYIESIRQTVQRYLTDILSLKGRKPVFSLDDVHRFKLLGGFNNDWDTVYGMLLYVQHLMESRGNSRSREFSVEEIARLKNLRALAKKTPRPCGIAGIAALVRDKSNLSYDLARDMFQEIYLGEKLFRSLYRRDVMFTRSRGLILTEKPLIPKKILKSLAGKFKLGIVTGRIRFEAEYVLKRFGIRSYFKAMITHDEVEKAERRTGKILRKPHPFPVLECAKKLRSRSFLYVGDLPDDIRAANRAKREIRIRSAGFLYRAAQPSAMHRELRNADADVLILKPEELLKF